MLIIKAKCRFVSGQYDINDNMNLRKNLPEIYENIKLILIDENECIFQ